MKGVKIDENQEYEIMTDYSENDACCRKCHREDECTRGRFSEGILCLEIGDDQYFLKKD
jgi:hypothetical protein